MNEFPAQNSTISDVVTPSLRTALVLGGGGSAGNAWVIGVIAGLFGAGVDVTHADLTIGTSSGSTSAAQIIGPESPTELLTGILDATLAPPTPPIGADNRRAPRPLVDHLERMRRIIAASADVGEMRRKFGAIALEADAASDGDTSARWRAIVAARLSGQQWPDQRLVITAVDAVTGEPVAFDRDSGVDLVDAVAASTSGGGTAYRIGDRSYIDGGYRTNSANADLAAGYARVLVLSPLGGKSLHPMEWGTHLATQIDELRFHGSQVKTVFPDADSEPMFGARGMDPRIRPLAARAGHAQGKSIAEDIADFWR